MGFRPGATPMLPFALGQFTVVPSNTEDFAFFARSLKCNAAGDVAVVDIDGTVAVYTVRAGEEIPVACKRVNATGTTVAAGSIRGWY